MDHGDQLAQDSLKKNPAKMITLMNACCNMANSGLAIDKQKQKLLAPCAIEHPDDKS